MKNLTFKNRFIRSLTLTVIVFLQSILIAYSQTLCTEPGTEQHVGEQDGYRYELWNQHGQGTGCMTLGEGALFSGEWDGIENYLARRGLGYNKTQEHQEIGYFYSTYNCDYNPNSSSGNSYLSIYGWTVDPLIEFYIVEDWRNWIPSMADGATNLGTFEANGSEYELIKNTRVNQPSIEGTATFEQYFSIRKNTRNSGTINISEHFEKWEELGLEMGKMFEVSFVVEGYKSSGSFDFTELDVFLGDAPVSVNDLVNQEQVIIENGLGSGNISIKLNESITAANVQIFDSSGKLVHKANMSDSLVVSNLKGGVYIVNVKGNGINYKSKISVIK